MDCFVTYILFSPPNKKIYIGSSGSFIQRFYAHNKLDKKGWTVKYRPWVVVYVEFYDRKSDSFIREDQFKQANWRKRIWEAIERDFDNLGYINLIKG